MAYPTTPVVLDIRTNWSGGFKEILEWKTSIFTSHSGKEQRRSLRRVPRRNFEYNYDAFGMKAQTADNLLWGNQNRTYVLPVWSDKSPLLTAASAADVTLDVDTTLYSFKVGEGIFITFDGLYEIALIDSMTSGSITMTLPLDRAWPAKSNVSPTVFAHLPTTLSGKQSTDNVKSGTLQLMTSPDNTFAFLPDTPAAVLMFEGFEVLTTQPDWQGGISINNEFQFDVVDFDIGTVKWFDTQETARMTRGYTWLLTSRLDILAFRAFLKRLNGCLKTIWIPSWTQDFTMSADYTTAANRLFVLENQYGTLLEGNPDRSVIMIRMTDGTKVIRRITAVDIGIGGPYLTLDTPLPSNTTKSQVKAIHFMMRHRLATDTLTIQWATDTVATVQTAFITVPTVA